jgi:sulfonate transport system substrate-binding protein
MSFPRILSIAAAVLLHSLAQAGAPLVVRYGYQPGHLQVTIARTQGWIDQEFAKDGISFKYEKFISGPPLIEAFVGGRLDFGQVGDQPALQAKANNADLKAIGLYASSEKGYALLVRKAANVTSVKALKGRKIGVTIGSVGHQLLYLFLKREGLKPSDIQVVNLSPGDIITSLSAGHIDAGVTWEPFLTQALTNGSSTVLVDATGYKNIVCPIIARTVFLKAHPDVATRLLKLFDRANKWAKANPDKAVEILAKEAGFKPEALRPIFEKNDFSLQLTPAAVASMRATASFLRENGVIRRDVKVEDVVDTRYLVAAGLQAK